MLIKKESSDKSLRANQIADEIAQRHPLECSDWPACLGVEIPTSRKVREKWGTPLCC